MTRELKDIGNTSSNTGKHKEEYDGRMKADLEDRLKLRKKLAGCIKPFTETGSDFSTGIFNITNGNVTPASKTNHQCISLCLY